MLQSSQQALCVPTECISFDCLRARLSRLSTNTTCQLSSRVSVSVVQSGPNIRSNLFPRFFFSLSSVTLILIPTLVYQYQPLALWWWCVPVSTITMAMTGAFHGRDRFDPVLIVAQIVLLQASFYVSYLLLLLLFQRATGTYAPVFDQIFNYRRVTLSHFPGWITASALIVSMIAPTALAFVALVGRSKRAVDFTATLFISHLIATSFHSGFPTSLMWWLLNLIAAAGLAAVAEAVSLRIELRDIAISRPSTRDRDRDRERERERERERDRDTVTLQREPKRDIENPDPPTSNDTAPANASNSVDDSDVPDQPLVSSS